jgi:hypothetical protein
MFLDIDDEGNVRVKKGGLKIPSLQELYASDKRSAGKPFFEKCITLMYHLNKRVHELSNLGPKERLDRVQSMYFPDVDVKKILENPKYIRAQDDYISLEYTSVQRLYEGIKKSLEHWKLYMANIPMTKKVKFEKMQEIVVDTDDGTKKVEVLIKTIIDVDNSEEYLKAMKIADEMIEREEKMQKRVIREEQQSKLDSEDSMLESGNFDHILRSKVNISNTNNNS